MTTEFLKIDGSMGEGGGQILRSSLALACITQTPIHIHSIRAKRKKPGLMNQHLTCVKTTMIISQGHVDGLELNSQEIFFTPHLVNAGNYTFDIGTAGSTLLVLQTIIYPLLMAKGNSSVTLKGGTHNTMAPTYEFIKQSFLPLLQKMGADVHIELVSAGFYPKGGGEIKVKIIGNTQWKPMDLMEKTKSMPMQLIGTLAQLPTTIVEREHKTINTLFQRTIPLTHKSLPSPSWSKGNALCLALDFTSHLVLFSSLGKQGLSAEKVAQNLYEESIPFINSKANIDEHLADQLVIPFALAKQGQYLVNKISDHLSTNIQVVQFFLKTKISVIPIEENLHRIEFMNHED